MAHCIWRMSLPHSLLLFRPTLLDWWLYPWEITSLNCILIFRKHYITQRKFLHRIFHPSIHLLPPIFLNITNDLNGVRAHLLESKFMPAWLWGSLKRLLQGAYTILGVLRSASIKLYIEKKIYRIVYNQKPSFSYSAEIRNISPRLVECSTIMWMST